MKSIAITITRGSTAYNLLHNDFYRLLREKYKIFLFTSAFIDDRFLPEFSHPNVTLLPLSEKTQTKFERFLFFFHKHLIYNSTVNQKAKWGIIGDPNSRRATYLSYVLRRTFFIPLSHLKFLRDFVRWVDLRFTQKVEVDEFVSKFAELDIKCFISTLVTGDTEVAMMKAAKRLSIPTIGFPKSWDNLSKHGLRVKPDVLVVWNEFMREQAVQFHNYDPDMVTVVGIPQFDRYVDKSVIKSRKEFCEQYGLKPERKIILFGSEGKLFPSDKDVAEVIAKLINEDDFDVPSQLLIRPHYGYKNDEEKFTESQQLGNVVVDLFNNPSKNLRDQWDYSFEFADRFINCLYHADVLVNTASTLTLDAMAFDKPVVNVAFDGWKKLPYSKSIERWYETHYYRKVLSYEATWYVRSPEELRSAINKIFDKPSLKSEERAKLRNDFCYRLDGQSGQRFANFVDSVIYGHQNNL